MGLFLLYLVITETIILRSRIIWSNLPLKTILILEQINFLYWKRYNPLLEKYFSSKEMMQSLTRKNIFLTGN
jgi:hypothetical protein